MKGIVEYVNANGAEQDLTIKTTEGERLFITLSRPMNLAVGDKVDIVVSWSEWRLIKLKKL